MLHHIQKKIFNALVRGHEMRYSEIKPKEVEANLFMYHLNELIKAGLVEKHEKLYRLTQKGKLMATRYSLRQQDIRLMPSTLSVIFLTAADGQVLLYERARQPYLGSLGAPSGKIHFGETLREAAERELVEKCGYTAGVVGLTLRGEFSLVSFEANGEQNLQNHILGHVWTGQVGDDKRAHQNHAGKTFWANWEKQDYGKFIPGYKEIVEAINSSGKHFILDLKF